MKNRACKKDYKLLTTRFFTLTELLVVIGIIADAAIVMFAVTGRKKRNQSRNYHRNHIMFNRQENFFYRTLKVVICAGIFFIPFSSSLGAENNLKIIPLKKAEKSRIFP